MSEREKAERSFFWKGIILGLLTGILANLFVSSLMKLYDFAGYPAWFWMIATVLTAVFIFLSVRTMWKESQK